jgi:hypothetical protein
MSTVEVYHGPVHVASVETPETGEDALEYAYQATQNIEGSWSRPGNPDYREYVTVRAPLPQTALGQERGLRSSMMGDRFVLEGTTYEVASFGFKEVAGA